ncbi:ABC transporter permease [Spiroplasma helicoides]|uniref:ABC transporter permease n=1 Tax=Spiroplasma helicoides TaxID=216938 RepID=A0A1B3SKM5_9MOLU|nr:ABC transporter permease [Spiroplasma helicoides]AOG60470.1 ABC transporter permease [Spiroplasma helicoides]
MEKKVGKITLFNLLKFNFRTLFFEKTFVIFTIITNIFSLVVALVFSLVSSGQMINELFDFYAIIFINVFIFLLIIRVLNFFFVRKIDDKTIFITLANQISRRKIFFVIYLTVIFTVFSSLFFSYGIFNFTYLALNKFVLKEYVLTKTTYFLIFTLAVAFCLINFIIFLIIFLGSQPTLVISTLLMSLSFIANIPMKLMQQQNNVIRLTVKTGIDNQTSGVLTTVKDIYDAIDLQKIVSKGKIKYKYLSKAINEFLTTPYSTDDSGNNLYMTKSSFDNNSIIKKRYQSFWDEKLGLIDKDDKKNLSITYNADDENSPSIPIPVIVKGENMKESWIGKKVIIKFTLESHFISMNQLSEKIESMSDSDETKNILNDFYNFTNELKTTFPNLKKEKSKLFNSFISFVDNSNVTNPNELETNYIQDVETKEKVRMTTNDLNSLFIKRMNDINLSNSTLALSNDSPYKDYIDDFINKNLDFELMFAARVFENYFINYTTNWLYATYNSGVPEVIVNDENFQKYQKSMNTLNYITYVNPFYGTWDFYTKYTGFYDDDVWFEVYSDSSIDMHKQENTFLPYTVYNLSLGNERQISQNTYENFFDPIYYIGALLIITFFLIITAGYRFCIISIN